MWGTSPKISYLLSMETSNDPCAVLVIVVTSYTFTIFHGQKTNFRHSHHFAHNFTI